MTAVILVHWMLGGTWLRVLPPPRGTVSIDLQATWAASGSGMDGESREVVRLEPVVEPVERPMEELAARAVPVTPVGQLPPVERTEGAAEAPDPVRETEARLRDRAGAEPPLEAASADRLPAFPRSRRALRAGMDLDDRHRTDAWKPPSLARRRSDGARTDAVPTKRFSPQPRYPPDLLAAGVTGTVKLLVHVDRLGRVARARVYRSSGHQALDRAALEAVGRWRFEPARRAGLPVGLDVVVPVRFAIR